MDATMMADADLTASCRQLTQVEVATMGPTTCGVCTEPLGGSFGLALPANQADWSDSVHAYHLDWATCVLTVTPQLPVGTCGPQSPQHFALLDARCVDRTVVCRSDCTVCPAATCTVTASR